MTDLIDAVQLQELDDAIVELFDITLPAYEGQTATTVHLFNGLDQGTNTIWFPPRGGIGATLNEYLAFPIELTGMSMTASGAQSRPTLTTANLPSLTGGQSADETTLNDILEDGGFTRNSDLIGTRVEYRRTLLSKTFSSAGTGTAVEFPAQIFVIDRVSGETPITASFELTSPIDLEGLRLPSRVVIGRYCPWKYQGYSIDGDDGGCTWPTDSNGRFYDIDDSEITGFDASYDGLAKTAGDKVKTTVNGFERIWQAIRDVPASTSPNSNPFYWKRLDVCGKRLSSCKVRFQGNSLNSDLNTSVPLPFGGFPGSRTYK